MEQRKQRIIDKKFQLKAAYSTMGIFFCLIGLVLLIIGVNFQYDNNKIEKIIEEQQNVLNAQGEIINSMLQILAVKGGNNHELNAKIKEKSNTNIASIKNNMDTLKELVHRNHMIFLIVIVFSICVGFIFYPVLIRKTHKISGPIYIISQYIRDIINGKYPDLRPLRKNDELKDFYELFSQLVTFLKRRDNKKA